MRFVLEAVDTREGDTRHNKGVSKQGRGVVGKYVRGLRKHGPRS